ncbi:nuclear transport factor 2 family protein [Myxococcus xanthus]|uniref:SgcJ/EcaC family oxidoreductase n=1 Tax=Myxococcus xanthus TaxID=34 RepID=UPI001917084B|nr:nuclear transport factor 2 family protein [Myxococcus xanthus]QQR41368.1 nuclear transport factor 2 family protein [Myxococcus xanthus]
MIRLPGCCVVALLLAFLPSAVLAQQPTADAAIHDALRVLKQEMEDALNAQDIDRLLSHLHPDVSFTTMNNDVRVGKESIRAYYDEMMRGPNRVVDRIQAKFEVDDLTRLYGDTGIARGSSRDHYVLTDGTDIVIDGRWTCTLVREGDRWQIAAFHYSTNVFDNPLLTRVKHLALAGATVIGLGALVAGAAIGRRLQRRSPGSAPHAP